MNLEINIDEPSSSNLIKINSLHQPNYTMDDNSANLNNNIPIPSIHDNNSNVSDKIDHKNSENNIHLDFVDQCSNNNIYDISKAKITSPSQIDSFSKPSTSTSHLSWSNLVEAAGAESSKEINYYEPPSPSFKSTEFISSNESCIEQNSSKNDELLPLKTNSNKNLAETDAFSSMIERNEPSRGNMSLLTMLAEVASVTLHTDPAVNSTSISSPPKVRLCTFN